MLGQRIEVAHGRSVSRPRFHVESAAAEFALDRVRLIADLLDRSAELVFADANPVAPVADLIVLGKADALAVRIAGVGLVVDLGMSFSGPSRSHPPRFRSESRAAPLDSRHGSQKAGSGTHAGHAHGVPAARPSNPRRQTA